MCKCLLVNINLTSWIDKERKVRDLKLAVYHVSFVLYSFLCKKSSEWTSSLDAEP